MFYYYRSWRRYSKTFSRFIYIFILSILLGLVWSIFHTLLYDGDDDSINEYVEEVQKLPLIFCFVLSASNRHLTSSRAIAYTWGKRCDRFYFVTRLQNTSFDLMMLDEFENITDISSNTINEHTLNVLSYLQNKELFFSYQWFLRATDDSFVVMPNLRRLINQIEITEHDRPLVYVGDVEQMYKKYDISTSGSVMLFNRNALNRFVASPFENDEQNLELENRRCSTKMIYDHELVTCMRRIGININPVNDNLILSQNLSTYRMDKRLKVNYK
jgi:hypothetical protein